ncbi:MULTISPECIES: hypothetical protein [Actinomadura]|uniref:Uncharacterized protein n=1 Tax=Actinomadura yumaensis TaxID=111807 RepID=A0ABW2CW80_9ACTN|nr:hypothetical protein [Actinomadura sp. J1-007]MWK40558.1 hypothetical protein [Actinomadura sp. J1-007]
MGPYVFVIECHAVEPGGRWARVPGDGGSGIEMYGGSAAEFANVLLDRCSARIAEGGGWSTEGPFQLRARVWSEFAGADDEPLPGLESRTADRCWEVFDRFGIRTDAEEIRGSAEVRRRLPDGSAAGHG